MSSTMPRHFSRRRVLLLFRSLYLSNRGRRCPSHSCARVISRFAEFAQIVCNLPILSAAEGSISRVFRLRIISFSNASPSCCSALTSFSRLRLFEAVFCCARSISSTLVSARRTCSRKSSSSSSSTRSSSSAASLFASILVCMARAAFSLAVIPSWFTATVPPAPAPTVPERVAPEPLPSKPPAPEPSVPTTPVPTLPAPPATTPALAPPMPLADKFS
mmetsp:Transcript_17660/g.33285  ORF Transcript_17660/g.33285 Transcript_17660/m.33285 type:complete len:218 (-) Transcript_17660:99-752(-)